MLSSHRHVETLLKNFKFILFGEEASLVFSLLISRVLFIKSFYVWCRMKRRNLFICSIVACQLFVRPAIQVKIPLTRQYETLAIEFSA
jgi:hypothetical protein